MTHARKSTMTFEHSMLRTATLCLIAFGAVMVYSASSGTALLSQTVDSSYYLKRYIASAVLGLIALAYFSRTGIEQVRRFTPALLAISVVGLVAVMLPGIGLEVNGARRWLGAGPIQLQPSELAKIALVLYSANAIAERPSMTRSLRSARELFLVGGAIAGLVVLEPDLGTAIVVALTLGAILIAGGMKLRHLAALVGALAFLALILALIEPYRRARLTAFLNPWSDAGGSGFQSVQAMIAIGSGGPFGVGIGQSVQKLFYLPEAHTDMILAVIGEELGFLGISAVLFLYGMIAYAGLRAARKARDLYAKLVAAGITSVIVLQATVNFFAVLGVIPLTGVPLPFISYGNSNLTVLLAAMGILINVAQGGTATRAGRSAGGAGRHLRVVRDRDARKTAHRKSADGRTASGRAGSRRTTQRQSARSKSARGSRVPAQTRTTKAKQAMRKLWDAEDRDRGRRDRRARDAGARRRRRAAG